MNNRFQSLVGVTALFLALFAGTPRASAQEGGAVSVLEVSGPVEWQRANFPEWTVLSTNILLHPGDWVRTRARARALLRFSEVDLFRMDERSQVQIPAPARKRRLFDSLRGVFYFFHRGEPGEVELRSRLVNSVVRGTEFNLSVAEDGTTILSVLDGEVGMSNQFGQITLTNGGEGRVYPGQAPTNTAMIQAVNIIQWCLDRKSVV